MNFKLNFDSFGRQNEKRWSLLLTFCIERTFLCVSGTCLTT